MGSVSSAKINSEGATSFDKISNGSSFYNSPANSGMQSGSGSSKQRKRKERRDSYSEQDKKLSRCR